MSVSSRLATVHPLSWVVTALVVAALVAWPLGGWDTVAPSSEAVPRLAVGAVHRGEQFATRIVTATVGTASPRPFATVKSGETFLVVTADIENVTDEPQNAIELDDLLRMPDEAHPLYLVLASDHSSDPELQPGFATRVLLIWKVKADRFPVGMRVPIAIVDRTSYDLTLSTGTGWRNPVATASTTVTLHRGAAAKPDLDSRTDGSGS